MPKPSVRHAKYYAGRGVESSKIYIGKHHLNRIYSKVKRPKLDFLDSIKTRTSQSDPQTKNSFQLRTARSSNSILLGTPWFLQWTYTGGPMTGPCDGSSPRVGHISPAKHAWEPTVQELLVCWLCVSSRYILHLLLKVNHRGRFGMIS